MICRRCDRECDGTMMRTDRRYTRVSTMLATEAPRDTEGRFEFCHRCQRDAYFTNGVLNLLVRDLQWEINWKRCPPPHHNTGAGQ